MSEEIDEEWLECIPWTGEEKDLPTGGQTKIPGFLPENLVSRWEILDAEADEGSKFVKRTELKPGDIIIGARMNENSIKRLVATYGPRFAVLKQADGPILTCQEWYEKYHTDGLALWAIRNVRFSRKR